jgi:antitoxin (DNA-binding transcriptional repressor) of toxin-antitoxin stability system
MAYELEVARMSKIISVQDIRQSLATIANQAQAGETFVVVRNSKPVFKIVPPFEKEESGRNSVCSLAEITGKLDAAEASYDLSANDLDMIIHESHSEYGRK